MATGKLVLFSNVKDEMSNQSLPQTAHAIHSHEVYVEGVQKGQHQYSVLLCSAFCLGSWHVIPRIPMRSVDFGTRAIGLYFKSEIDKQATRHWLLLCVGACRTGSWSDHEKRPPWRDGENAGPDEIVRRICGDLKRYKKGWAPKWRTVPAGEGLED